MAIKDLLDRIKNNKESEKNSEKEFNFESSRNLIENQLPNNSVWFDKEILSKLSMEELLDKYDLVYSWLQTHECETGTNNQKDVNGRPYDHELYEKHFKLLEYIVLEMMSPLRPVYEHLRERLEKVGL